MKTKLFWGLAGGVAALVVGAQSASAQVEVPLRRILGPNHSIYDAACGVSATYPKGWEVVRAVRWGRDNEQTTVVLRPFGERGPVVNLFYQKFTPDSPRPKDAKDWFQDSYQKKQAARQKEVGGYRNNPKSLKFGTTATGLPMCSYTASFVRGEEPLVDHFVRVAGTESYVMFFTTARPVDIDTIRGEIEKMAETVKVP